MIEVKKWDDVIRNYKPKTKIEITHVERESLKLPKQHIGRPRKLRLTEPMPRLLPKTPRLPR
jgi:hypothetical protein